MIEIQKTVGEIAAEMPSTVRVFEKYGIDFCCGGNRPLEQACRERGIAVETLIAELQAPVREAGSTKNWSQAPLSELIQHILDTHHEYLRAELPTLEAWMARVIENHGQKYPDSLPALQQTYLALQEELYGHMHKEEMILFPSIRRMEEAATDGARFLPPFGTIDNPIRVMLHEHDNAAAALRQMRRLTNDYTLPADACATYGALFDGLQKLEADLHQHIHLENNILFPRAKQLER